MKAAKKQIVPIPLRLEPVGRKENFVGSKVYPYYRAGKLPEIIEYCKRDVESVRQVYKRLTFTK